MDCIPMNYPLIQFFFLEFSKIPFIYNVKYVLFPKTLGFKTLNDYNIQKSLHLFHFYVEFSKIPCNYNLKYIFTRLLGFKTLNKLHGFKFLINFYKTLGFKTLNKLLGFMTSNKYKTQQQFPFIQFYLEFSRISCIYNLKYIFTRLLGFKTLNKIPFIYNVKYVLFPKTLGFITSNKLLGFINSNKFLQDSLDLRLQIIKSEFLFTTIVSFRKFDFSLKELKNKKYNFILNDINCRDRLGALHFTHFFYKLSYRIVRRVNANFYLEFSIYYLNYICALVIFFLQS
ncbi:hypothetical protein AGLY_017800 [Aphis glycines]|uniref:Uncharacterized protein n=1 Tax=Aphis glycines TaxID=307491 RepID=A0A6G0SU14_APHGL|nr:hypothetical protein AGLY_017800 [Aphis glycines]